RVGNRVFATTGRPSFHSSGSFRHRWAAAEPPQRDQPRDIDRSVRSHEPVERARPPLDRTGRARVVLMGSLVGLLLGLGLLSIWTARDPGRPRKRATPSLLARLADTIVRSGVQGVTPARLIVASAGLGFPVAMSVLAVPPVRPPA